MEASRLGLFAVLFIVVAGLVDLAAGSRRLQERPLPVMSHLPVIIPTFPKHEPPFIPRVGFPRFPKIGLPGFRKPEVPGEPVVAEEPEPQVPEQPLEQESLHPEVEEQKVLEPDLPPIPEAEQPKVRKNPKVLVEPEASEAPPPTVKSEEPLDGPVLPTAATPPQKIKN